MQGWDSYSTKAVVFVSSSLPNTEHHVLHVSVSLNLQGPSLLALTKVFATFALDGCGGNGVSGRCDDK